MGAEYTRDLDERLGAIESTLTRVAGAVDTLVGVLEEFKPLLQKAKRLAKVVPGELPAFPPRRPRF